MRGLRERYGASPLHLLAMLVSSALAGFAAWSLIQDRPIAVAVWFVGAAIGHDVVLLPLYSIADRGLHRFRRRPTSASESDALPTPVLNYIRLPAAISALLLLVYLPSIARLSSVYTATTGLSSSGYFVRWLAVTGTLFLISALTYALRLRRNHRPQPTTTTVE